VIAGLRVYGSILLMAAVKPGWWGQSLGGLAALILVGQRLIPSHCIQSEIQQQTLPCLAMLPQGGRGLYEGWLRGVKRLPWRSFALPVILLAVSAWLSPFQAGAWALLSLVLSYAAPPLMFVTTMNRLERTTAQVVRRVIVGLVFGTVMMAANLQVALALGAAYALLRRKSALGAMDGLVDRAACR
jgi:hypothetical protein